LSWGIWKAARVTTEGSIAAEAVEFVSSMFEVKVKEY
jgi:hypothetical protein